VAVLWVVIAALLFPPELFAHGVEVYNITGGTPYSLCAASFISGTGEPMAFAEVFVYPPSSPDWEIQRGKTDRNGVFCFLPDEEGSWRLEAEYGTDSKGAITIAAASLRNAAIVPDGTVASRVTLPYVLLLGLSLVVNLFVIVVFRHRMKRRGAGVYGQRGR
jgi:nickel transport protein